MNCWEELVNANSWAELIHVNCWEELISANSWALLAELFELRWILRPHDLCRVDELVKVSYWALGAVALVAFQPSCDVVE